MIDELMHLMLENRWAKFPKNRLYRQCVIDWYKNEWEKLGTLVELKKKFYSYKTDENEGYLDQVWEDITGLKVCYGYDFDYEF